MNDPLFTHDEPTGGQPACTGDICAPELDSLIRLRDALLLLKGPLANSPSVRNQIERQLLSNEVHERVLGKLALGTPSRLPGWSARIMLQPYNHQN